MRIFLIFFFIFTVNCSTDKVSNNHGSVSLQEKYAKITLNKSNKNDILKIIGPPSTISSFDKNKWFYIQTKKVNQSLYKLGIKKIEKNNILVVSFNNKGILNDKKILKINDMKNIKYVKDTTSKKYRQNNTIYNILSSLREKANAPLKNRSKK